MPVRSRFAALVLVSLLLTWPRPSRAQGGPAPAVVIAWTAPPGCPGVDEVTADVERILGRPLAGTAVTIQARATVTMDGSGTFRLHLETTEQDGTHARDLEGRTCANVARATALIIALAVDPEAGTRSASAPTAPDPPRPSPPPPLVPAPAAMSLRVAGGRPASSSGAPSLPIGPWLLRVAGGFDADSLPRLAPEATLALGVIVGRARIEVLASYAARERALLAGSNAAAGGDIGLGFGGGRGCYLLVPWRVDVSGCAGLEVGSIFGTGFGVTTPTRAAPLWLAPSFGGLGVVRLAHRVALALQVEGVVPLLREHFILEGLGGVFRPPTFTVQTAIGLEVRLR